MASDLQELRTAIRKKLRSNRLGKKSPGKDLVDGEVLLKAVAAGFSVKGDITLVQLSDLVDFRLQEEVLSRCAQK